MRHVKREETWAHETERLKGRGLRDVDDDQAICRERLKSMGRTPGGKKKAVGVELGAKVDEKVIGDL